MDKFEFTLSKEKFKLIHADVDDSIYTATLISDDTYLVKWDTEEGWGGVEYSKPSVEDNVAEGYWVKI